MLKIWSSIGEKMNWFFWHDMTWYDRVSAKDPPDLKIEQSLNLKLPRYIILVYSFKWKSQNNMMNGFQRQENVDNYFLLLKTRLSAILRWIWHIFPIFLVDKQKRNSGLHFFCYHSDTLLKDIFEMILIMEC